MPLSISCYVPQCGAGGRGRAARRALVVWGAAAAGALSLVGLVVAAPLLLAAGRGLFAFVLYKGFAVACHQMPERSFHLLGHPLAVCARCLGLYAGVAAAISLYPLVRAVERVDTPARAWLVLAALPAVIDFSLGFIGVWENTHLSRFLTSSLLGATAAFFIVPGMVDVSRMIDTQFARRAGSTATPGA